MTHFVTLSAVIAVLGGLYWWATKVIGRPASQGLGGLAAVGLLLGTVLLAFPNIISALLHAHSKSTKKGVFQALATAEVVGGALVIVGVLAIAASLLGATRRWTPFCRGGAMRCQPIRGRARRSSGSPHHRHPWRTSSILPTVASAEPLLDQREEASA